MIEKRRFKRENGTDYPEWEKVRIGDVFTVTRGKVLATSLTKQQSDESFTYPVYSSQTKANGLMGFYDEFLFTDAITWTTDVANAGEVRFRRDKFYCTNVCGVLLSEKYANTAVSIAINRVTHKYVSYVGNPKLMNGVMSVITLSLPASTSEMTRISSLFEKIDQKINLLTKKKEALETYKKGLMQKIFSQELRFKREDGTDYPEWERVTIVDIAKVIGGGTPDTNVPLFWNGNINWFTPTEVGKKKYLSESKRTITNEGLMRSSAKLLPKGTILLSTRATIGETSIIRAESTTNQGFQNLVVSDSNDIEFVYYLISAMRKELLRRSSGSTFMEISKKEIAKIQCSIPILEEQQKIGLCLSSIDLKINQMDKKKEEVIKMKKGLLQQMFV